jgi:hypothetical protein
MDGQGRLTHQLDVFEEALQSSNWMGDFARHDRVMWDWKNRSIAPSAPRARLYRQEWFPGVVLGLSGRFRFGAGWQWTRSVRTGQAVMMPPHRRHQPA